jgi:hypothetical protein
VSTAACNVFSKRGSGGAKAAISDTQFALCCAALAWHVCAPRQLVFLFSGLPNRTLRVHLEVDTVRSCLPMLRGHSLIADARCEQSMCANTARMCDRHSAAHGR